MTNKNINLHSVNTGNHDIKELLMKSPISTIIPKKLYKYYTINEYFFKFIKENKCWFSAPKDFNDPFDCRLKIKIGNNKEEILLNMEQSGLLSMMLQDFSSENMDLANKIIDKETLFNETMTIAHQEAINQTIGIYCMTERPNNILMWAHYADSHRGVCVEFDIEENGLFYKDLMPVQYEKKYPIFELSQYREGKNMFYDMHLQLICTKSTLWKYEKEWRVIVDGGRDGYPFKKEHLTKIIFGVNTPNDVRENVISSMKINGYFNTNFSQCELSDNKYELKIKDF